MGYLFFFTYLSVLFELKISQYIRTKSKPNNSNFRFFFKLHKFVPPFPRDLDPITAWSGEGRGKDMSKVENN